MKKNSIIDKFIKLTSFSACSSILYEPHNAEMKETLKMIVNETEGYFSPLFPVFYDRVNDVFYSLEANEIYSSKEINELSGITVCDFDLKDFNRHEQLEMISKYESFKRDHAFLFKKVCADNEEYVKTTILEKAKIYPIMRANYVEALVRILDLSHDKTNDPEVLGLIRKTCERYLNEFDNSCFAFGVLDEEKEQLYLVDSDQIKEFQTSTISSSLHDSKEWIVNPFAEPITISEAKLNDIAKFESIQRGIENVKLNHPELWETNKKYQKTR